VLLFRSVEFTRPCIDFICKFDASVLLRPMSEFRIEPITINWGNFETLETVTDLARVLLHRWPGSTEAQAYVTALMVCSAVLENGLDDRPEDARLAFVDAAREAGMSVSPDDDGLDW
jgi:hypothetical protein